MIEIRPGAFDDQRILGLLRYHFAKCHEVTPPGSAHVLGQRKCSPNKPLQVCCLAACRT